MDLQPQDQNLERFLEIMLIKNIFIIIKKTLNLVEVPKDLCFFSS